MIDAIQLDEASPGDAISRVPHRLDADVFVASAVESQRRDLNRRERVAHADFAVHQRHRLDRPGARAALYPAPPPSLGGRVAGGARSQLAQPAVVPLIGTADAVLAREPGSVLLARLRPRVLLGAEPGQRRAVEHERRGPLWIGRREQHRHRAALGKAHDRGTLRAGGVHDGADVVHARLEIGNPLGAVGHPQTALVEQDQPGERGHAAVEVERAALPRDAEVGQHPAADEDHIHRAVTDNAVGDMDITAGGVPDLRTLHR